MIPGGANNLPAPFGGAAGMAPLSAKPGRYADPPPASETSAFLWNVPIGVLAALIITHFGRPFEFVLSGYKLPFVISLIGVLTVVMTRALKGLASAPGIPLTGLVLWMIICCPFSTWRGGSVQYVLYFAALQVTLFLLAASAPRSFRDIRRAGY